MYGDHSSHENELTVLVVADSEKKACVKACDLQLEKRPEWSTDETTYLHVGFRSMDSAEYRGFIDDTQRNVIVGPDVPV
jgi:hypothetical protein